jgi:glycosyltransferase involved in cell wall biosynthesis
MKLFEYLASRTPIVASDLPSLREVLNENNSILVTPDEPVKLAAGIKLILADPALADILSRQASQDVLAYSWDERAKKLAIAIGL